VSALSGDGTVLVHCNQGVSRSSTVTIAFLMERFNVSIGDYDIKKCKVRNANLHAVDT
jgi:protein-tyrosine phosphatase